MDSSLMCKTPTALPRTSGPSTLSPDVKEEIEQTVLAGPGPPIMTGERVKGNFFDRTEMYQKFISIKSNYQIITKLKIKIFLIWFHHRARGCKPLLFSFAK